RKGPQNVEGALARSSAASFCVHLLDPRTPDSDLNRRKRSQRRIRVTSLSLGSSFPPLSSVKRIGDSENGWFIRRRNPLAIPSIFPSRPLRLSGDRSAFGAA